MRRIDVAIAALPWLLLLLAQVTFAALVSPRGGAAAPAADGAIAGLLSRKDSVRVVFGSTSATPKGVVSAPKHRPRLGAETRKVREKRKKPRGRLLSSDGFLEDDMTDKGDRDCDDFESSGGGGGGGGGYKYDHGGQSGNSSGAALNPCHDDPSGVAIADDDVNHSDFPDETSSNGTEVTVGHGGGDNHVVLRVFVALRPNEPSRGALVTQVASLYVNATNQDGLWIDLSEHYASSDDRMSEGGGGSRQRKDQGLGAENLDVGDSQADPVVEESLYQFGTGGNATSVNVSYVVRHHHTDSDLELEDGSWWWWEYEIYFDVFSPDSSPLFEPSSLDAVAEGLRVTLQSGLESGDFYDWMMNAYNGSFGALDISTDRAAMTNADPAARPTTSSQVFLTVYIAFRPREPARRTLVTGFISEYLEDVNPSYEVILADHDDGLDRRQQRSVRGLDAKWTMVHTATYSDTVKKGEVWWWEFNLVYDCSSATSSEPVTDPTILEAVSSDIQRTIQGGIDDGSIYVWLGENFSGGNVGILDMTTHSYMIGDIDGPNVGHTTSDSEDPSGLVDPDKLAEYRTPVNPNEWNWLRFLGLGVFTGTVLVTFVLMHLAAYRHRAMEKQERWGNLATVKGVEEVLQTGWTIRGTNMEIFDKSKLGYDDDHGSLLIGGCEQRVILGAEISVVKQGSEATPETHPNSITHKTVSDYASEHLRLPDTNPPRRTGIAAVETKPESVK